MTISLLSGGHFPLRGDLLECPANFELRASPLAGWLESGGRLLYSEFNLDFIPPIDIDAERFRLKENYSAMRVRVLLDEPVWR